MRRSYAGHGVNFVNFAVIGKLYIGEFGNELALILDMRGRVGVGVDDTGVGHGEFMDGIFAAGQPETADGICFDPDIFEGVGGVVGEEEIPSEDLFSIEVFVMIF